MPDISTTRPARLGALDIEALTQADLAAREMLAYRISFVLNTGNILGLGEPEHALEWSSIRYGTEEIDKVPDDKRGIYAFVISDRRAFLPPHGYIMYIGIAGKDSNRSLRDRYRDYFSTSQVKRRVPIITMIVRWNRILRFFFAPVAESVSPEQLKALEQNLITAFLPPCCQNDIKADTRRQVPAFS